MIEGDGNIVRRPAVGDAIFQQKAIIQINPNN